MLESVLAKPKQWYVFAKNNIIWSLPIKFVLGALLGALGGSSLLGVLSEYATYFYAVSYGIRPPTEGVPYLKASVTLISFLMLISGALIYCLTTLIFKWFTKLTMWTGLAKNTLLRGRAAYIAEKSVSDLRILFADKSWIVTLIASVVAGAITFAVAKVMGFFVSPDVIPSEVVHSMAMAYSVFGGLAFLTVVRPRTIVWVSLIATSVYFVGWLAFLFVPSNYSNLLRFVGYGGGLPVSIEMKEPGSSQMPLDKTLYLIIRTTDAFIVLNESKHEFVEIPKQEVRTIRHSTGGLNNLLFYLPDVGRQITDQKGNGKERIRSSVWPSSKNASASPGLGDQGTQLQRFSSKSDGGSLLLGQRFGGLGQEQT